MKRRTLRMTIVAIIWEALIALGCYQVYLATLADR